MASEEPSKISLELEELKKFLSEASFDRTKEVLRREIIKVEAEISATKAKIVSSEPAKAKRVNVQLHEHAFDQSDKFVKIYIPFSGDALKDENVAVEFTESSFKVFIETENKNYEFIVNNLLKYIDVGRSYKKTKPDMVSVYMKKVKDGEKWDCLTVTEKRLKDLKNKAFEEDKEANSSDPMGGLMNIMKKMYDSGDSEMKRTIAKAWTEGQEKNRQNPNPF